MLSTEEKKQILNATLNEKITRSKQLIFEWYYQFNKNVYVSFSGGKDSTVLLHLVRSMFPDVPAVFVDTGLEYPAIRDFVKTVDNVTWLKPKLTFKQVLDKYGFPVISKEQSQYIWQYRTTKSDKMKDIRLNGNKWGQGKINNKWRFLIEAPFKISDRCCFVMKKNPAKKYEKDTGRKPFVGVMATESSLRAVSFLNGECNMFSAHRPISRPIIFWSDKDIWEYIKRNNLKYCELYDKGFDRTGCMFCMYGAHLEKDNRFQLMKEIYPKIYTYCMDKLGLKNVLDYIKNKGKVNK